MSHIKQKRKTNIEKTITHLTKRPNSLIEAIEITKLKDGSAVVTFSWGDKWCFSAEKAFRSRFIDGSCRPGYVIGEVYLKDELHGALHNSVKGTNTEGQSTAHYHIHLKKFKHVERLLNELQEYQEKSVFFADRAKIASYSRLNPLAFFQQVSQPKLCLTQDLIEPGEISQLLNSCNFSLPGASNRVSDRIPSNCTDGYLSPAFYMMHFAFWIAAFILLVDKMLSLGYQATRPRP